ncbi:hypothetical protein J1614_009992 [Plenodomus biglobosus]|nr:hypothetical protein J1614_009992 [Plenodomus biglobosus]
MTTSCPSIPSTPTLPSHPQNNINNSPCNHTHNHNDIATFRGPCLENTHKIHIAVVSPPPSTLTHSTNDPQRPTLARSALKPIQALATLSTNAGTLFSLSPADLALLCASHSSEPRHIARARSILQRTGMPEAVLVCGWHAAVRPAGVNREVEGVDRGVQKTGIYNNCSGKHVGMVAGALALGQAPESYAEFGGAMQERVRSVVREVGCCGDEEVQWAVDGCNLPAPALPLVGLARMFAGVAAARDGVAESEGRGEAAGLRGEMGDGARGSGEDCPADERACHLAQIFDAMTSYPELVGGEGRFCTELMIAYEGLLIGKVGADGCYGIGIRASPCSSSSGNGDVTGHGAMGIAVKIEDGNLDILYAAIPEILKQLDIGTPEMRRKLDTWRFPVMKNTAGVVSGRLEHRFKILKVGQEES